MLTVVDLFSGAGGMSFGFHSHKGFKVIAAVDAQIGKPSSGKGTLSCNSTYEANIGIRPIEADLSAISPAELATSIHQTTGITHPDVLISCAPCTGYSRVVRSRLVKGDPRNNLVLKTADFVEELQPKVLVMENVMELLTGNFSYIFDELQERLNSLGYIVHADVHKLEEFGLPQKRRRVLVIAVKKGLKIHTLESLWEGWSCPPEATTVRHAIGSLEQLDAGQQSIEDDDHVSPRVSPLSLQRFELIPPDGGSWTDLLKIKGGYELLIPSHKKLADQGKVGGHRDVYGRLFWDRPAPTIKRECSSMGNGRYSHPEQNRLCTIRELATLQGFPKNYNFVANSLANRYRHIGDAVPPLISFQIANLCHASLKGYKPTLNDSILPNSTLTIADLEKADNCKDYTQQQGLPLEAAS
ncbi:MAG: DNA cytosine methyltransferase [Motiliproteus sp.]